ncbi:hypothetical protein PAXRUDRAFT_177109, partial [Paxillus rubicundulus Ve08.2h10]
AKTSFTLAVELGIPSLSKLISQFLFEQLHPASPPATSHLLPFTGHIKVFHSLHVCEHRQYSGGDCHILCPDNILTGMLGMDIAHIYCFFSSFTHTDGQSFPCALVDWFDCIADVPDKLTGMWMVSPSFLNNSSQHFAVIHINSII